MYNHILAKVEYEERVRRVERAALRPRIAKRNRFSTSLKSLLTFIAGF